MTGKMRNKRNQVCNYKTEKYKGKQKILNKGRYTSFLEKYKIWFETVMYVTLSICAIFVSFQANIISKQQYDYERKKDIPLIYMDSYVTDDIETKWVVNNAGGKIKNCTVSVEHFIRLNNKKTKKLIYIDMDSNYNETYVKEGDYLPFSFDFPKLMTGRTIEYETFVYCNDMGYKYMNVDCISYVDISYSDINDVMYKKYYIINRAQIDEVDEDLNLYSKIDLSLNLYDIDGILPELKNEINKMYN